MCLFCVSLCLFVSLSLLSLSLLSLSLSYLAVASSKKELAFLLLEKGANVEAQAHDLNTPLHLGPEPEEIPLPSNPLSLCLVPLDVLSLPPNP